MSATKLVLGAAQLGLDYGIANRQGQPSRSQAHEILSLAADSGIALLDTAPAYGESESIIGDFAPAAHGVRIVTKTPALPPDAPAEECATRIRESLAASLERLQVPSVDTLLAHCPEELISCRGSAVFDAMLRARDAGLTRRVGVSVYTGDQLRAVAERYAVDVVQLPINALDQRLRNSGALAWLADRGIQIHARSVFLQGLLLMEPAALPAHLAAARSALEGFRRVAAMRGFTALEAAIGFVLALDEIEHVLVGVEDVAQLRQILTAAERSVDPQWMAEVAVHDAEWLDPSRWPEK